MRFPRRISALSRTLRDLPYRALAAGTVIVLLHTERASAQASGGLGTVATNVTNTFDALGQLILGGMFLGGVGIGGAGLMKLKQAAETQGQQVKYSEGMWRVGVGAGLIAIPAVLTTLNTTFFGSPDAGTARVGTIIPR